MCHYYHYFHPRILACDSDLYIQGPGYFAQIPRTQNAKNGALLCCPGLVPIPLLLNLWLPKSESWIPSFLTLFFKIALFQWCPNNVNFLNVFLFILLLSLFSFLQFIITWSFLLMTAVYLVFPLIFWLSPFPFLSYLKSDLTKI